MKTFYVQYTMPVAGSPFKLNKSTKKKNQYGSLHSI